MEKELEALEFGKWYPIEEYYKRVDELDWALVQFKETESGVMTLPYRAEYKKRDRVWATYTDSDRYLCELCEPVAFMLWQPYEQAIKDSNPNPNEVMKALEDIYRNGVFLDMNGHPRTYSWETNKSFSEQITLVKQALLKAQELEKENAKLKESKTCEIINFINALDKENDKILDILKESPFILQKIFENKGLKNQEEFDKRYFFGTITEDKYQTIKEWLEK